MPAYRPDETADYPTAGEPEDRAQWERPATDAQETPGGTIRWRQGAEACQGG